MKTTQLKCPTCGSTEKRKKEERRALAAKKQAGLKPLPVLAILLILAAIGMFTGCTLEPEELPALTMKQLEQRLHESWAAASDDDKRADEWGEVIGLLGQILALNPDNADLIEKLYAAHINYGLQFLAEGDPDGAVAQFNSAQKIKPDGVEAQAGLEQAATLAPTPTPVVVPPTSTPPQTLTVEQLEQRLHESWAAASDDDKRAEEWGEVTGWIEQILAINPGNADMIEKLYAAHVNYGIQLVAEGRIEEAKTEFTRALDVKPDGGEAIAGLSALAGEPPGLPPVEPPVEATPEPIKATPTPITATPIPPVPPPAADAAMIAIPAGEFIMGSDVEDERPPHVVSVGAFEIDKLEATNQEFERFVQETGYVTDAEKASDTSWRYYAKDKPQHPVVKVTWNDAIAFCEWAGKRLPTEAEWEKAARGADARSYPWGNQWDAARANAKEAGNRGTTAVGSFPAGASPYGVLDMAGNVAEWTSDWFNAYPGGDFYSPYFGEKYRVIRGGGWFSDQNLVRTTERSASSMILANDDVGFRCAR